MSQSAEFNTAFAAFLTGVNEIVDTDAQRYEDTYKRTKSIVEVRSIGAKYIALDRIEVDHETGERRNQGVYCFVATVDNHTKGMGLVRAGGIAIWRADCGELRRLYENLGFCISNASFERMLQGVPDTQAFKSYAGHFAEPMGVH